MHLQQTVLLKELSSQDKHEMHPWSLLEMSVLIMSYSQHVITELWFKIKGILDIG